MVRGLYKIKQSLKNIRFIYQPYKRIKSCFIDPFKSKAVKEHGMEIVMSVDKELAKTPAVYFVDFGTLLGIIREGSFVKWDTDIDFGIIFNESFTWSELTRVLSLAGFVLKRQFSFKNVITEQTYKKRNINIDFFRHFIDENRSYHYYYYKKNGYKYESEYQYHVRFVETVKLSEAEILPILDGYVHTPSNPEVYLAGLYGKNWRIPDPEWTEELRPNSKCLDDGELAEVKFFH